MKAKEAMAGARALRGDEYGDGQLLSWLEGLEGRIRRELIAPLDGGGSDELPRLDAETELSVKRPYEELYILWLMMRIDAENGDIDRYNNEKRCFDDLLSAYRADRIARRRPAKITLRYRA